MTDRWPHCPHYDLGPPDEEGQQVCAQCGGVLLTRAPGYLTRPVPKIREGADVDTEVKLYPPEAWR